MYPSSVYRHRPCPSAIFRRCSSPLGGSQSQRGLVMARLATSRQGTRRSVPDQSISSARFISFSASASTFVTSLDELTSARAFSI